MEFVAGLVVGLLIGSFSPAWKYFFGKTQEKSEKIISTPLKEYVPEFSAEIVGKKKYVRGQDFISFQSKYKGKLKNGYFVNEISVPKFDPQYPSLFVPETPFVSTDLEKTMSYCSETINNPNNRMGNINGNKDTGWIAWEWSIPDNAPLGKYSVKMMIFNGGEEKPLMSPIEDEFEVVSPSDKINFI